MNTELVQPIQLKKTNMSFIKIHLFGALLISVAINKIWFRRTRAQIIFLIAVSWRYMEHTYLLTHRDCKRRARLQFLRVLIRGSRIFPARARSYVCMSRGC